MSASEAPRPDTLPATSLCDADLLIHSLSYDLDRPVLTFADTGEVVTARDFRDTVSRYAQALASKNLGKGARIGLISRNRPEVLIAFAAITFLDLCIVPLHPVGSLDDIGYMVEDARIEALVFDSQHYQDMARQLDARVPHLAHLLALGTTSVGEDLTALADTFQPAPLVAPRREAEDIVRLSYSGGTTGLSKGIMDSARCIRSMTDILIKEWEWPSDIRHLICSPLSHAGGVMLVPTMLKGGSMVVLPGFDATAVLEAIQQHRITSMLVVPTMIYALLDHPRLDEYDLSSLEVIYYGSSTISPTRLREAIAKFGPVFFQFYGQAEAPMSLAVMKRADHDPSDLARLASCGRPVPWVRVALLDDDNRPVPDGEPGEICAQGALLMSGYLNKPEQTAQAFAGGWLHTGDIAVRDPDGFLRIVDRKKDMIITGGFNVYPREVEDALCAHPAVAAAAVIGLPHDKWGEAVTAVVVLRADMNASEAELIALVRERKGAVQAPKSIHFVDAIPLSGVGKPDKKALRTQMMR